MKLISIVGVILFSLSSFAAHLRISENAAVLIARSYVVGAKYEFDGNLNDIIYEADKVTTESYEFLLQDSSGDCGLTIVVNFDGSIAQDKTKEHCL